jgi:hypothetical protein
VFVASTAALAATAVVLRAFGPGWTAGVQVQDSWPTGQDELSLAHRPQLPGGGAVSGWVRGCGSAFLPPATPPERHAARTTQNGRPRGGGPTPTTDRLLSVSSSVAGWVQLLDASAPIQVVTSDLRMRVVVRARTTTSCVCGPSSRPDSTEPAARRRPALLLLPSAVSGPGAMWEATAGTGNPGHLSAGFRARNTSPATVPPSNWATR